MYTIDDLKQQLADGKLTEAQYAQMARLFCGEYVAEHPEEFPEDEPPKAAPDEAALEKLVQAAVDRATNKLGNENKALREEREKLEKTLKAKMTDEERAALEAREANDKLAQRERDLQERENRWYAIEAIKKAGLDDGGEKSLALVDFVLAADAGAIDERVSAFHALVKRFVQDEIDKTFKGAGRSPVKGGGADAGPNPWKKETWNMTEQMKIETDDPQRAEMLRSAAGAQ